MTSRAFAFVPSSVGFHVKTHRIFKALSGLKRASSSFVPLLTTFSTMIEDSSLAIASSKSGRSSGPSALHVTSEVELANFLER